MSLRYNLTFKQHFLCFLLPGTQIPLREIVLYGSQSLRPSEKFTFHSIQLDIFSDVQNKVICCNSAVSAADLVFLLPGAQKPSRKNDLQA